MIYRRLSPDWDYQFGQGKNNYLHDLEAVGQAIRSRLLLLYSEWWEDQEDGLPLFEEILGASGSPDSVKAVDVIIRDRILGTTGVSGIADFSSSIDDRKYKFEAVVDTIYGQLTINNYGEVV